MEEGCISDIKVNSLECSRLLVKNGNSDILLIDSNNTNLSTNEPTQDNHIATKKYVDDNSGGGGGGGGFNTEQIQDIVGAMVSSNTETGITVTYQDSDGTIDFVVSDTFQVKPTEGAFVDGDKTKLDNIEINADVTDTANVTAAGALMDSELTDLAGVKGVTISTLQVKPSEGAFANGDKTKLDGIEASADVTDAANVAAAGALMDSELTDLAGVKGVTISTLQVKPSEGAFANGDKTKLDGIEASADVTDTANVTAAGALMDSELTDLDGVKGVTISTLQVKPSEGAFANGDKTKLDGIEASADVTDATNVADAGAVMETIIDAKGDILVGTSNDTIIRLPVGTNNYVLSADSSTTSGLKWKAVSGGGGGSSTFEELTDTETFSGNAGKILKLNTAENLLEFVDESSGGSSTFLNLSDVTPSSYSGQSGKSVVVNSSENGLEFGTINTITTAERNKLTGIEASADVTDTANVTAAGALMDSELTDLAGVKGVTISTLQVKPSEGAFADGDKTKLDSIETNADVTDATNVAAAGAVMNTGDETIAGIKTFSSTIVGDINGNAATATTLATARTIGGVSFDGSANINLPGVNSAGDQDTTGNAATATTSTVSTNVTATANNSTDETVYLTFVDGATGSQGIETDTGLTYNPSSGLLTSTSFAGALTGNVTGNTSGSSGSCTGNAATATTLATAKTIGGVAFNGSANINLPGVNQTGNQNTTGSAATLTNARTIGGVSFNGSENINLPGVNQSGNQNTTGNAATATALANPRTIGGVSFDGSADINLPGVNSTGNQNITGSAETLTNARTIGGVSFNGSTNIDLPGVNLAGNQNTTGNAATATILAFVRTIGGVSFDGSADINLPGVNEPGNQNTSGSAATLTNVRTIGGVSFNGSADINLPGVNQAGNQDTSGNAATATTLATARTIGGVSFDGSANIDLPGVNSAGNQNTTGNADTSTVSTNVTATANNNTDETVYLTFVGGATGNQGIETDTGLTYNPSSGLLTATSFAGAIMENIIDAKGDILVGTSNDTITRLPVSTVDNYVLTADSNESSGVKWAASSGGGSALTVQDEGSALANAATTLNFVGSGVTASGTGSTKTITVNGIVEAPFAGAGGNKAFTSYGLYNSSSNTRADIVVTTTGHVGGYYSTSTMSDKLHNNILGAGDSVALRHGSNNNLPVAFAYEFTTPQIITKYRIWRSDNTLGKLPKTWELRGADKSTYVSDNSSTYTVLDSRSNVTSYTASSSSEVASDNLDKANDYNLSTTGAFKYYVLHITANNGDTYAVAIGEWALYGSASSSLYGDLNVILQVQSTQFIGQAFANLSTIASALYEYKFGANLDVSITPKYSNSKIIIHCSMFVEVVRPWDVVGLLKRDSTYLRGTPTGSRVTGIAGTMGNLSNNFDSTPDSINMLYVDSPNTTNSITYSPVLHRFDNASESAFLNKCEDTSTLGYFEQGTSTIVIYEIRQ